MFGKNGLTLSGLLRLKMIQSIHQPRDFCFKRRPIGCLLTIAFFAFFLYGCKSCREGMLNRFTFHPTAGIETDLGRFEAPFFAISLKTSDGIQISAFHAPNVNGKRMLIYFHGNAGNASDRLGDAERLWQMGVSVLLVDYRGFGGSDGAPSEKGIYLDAKAALDYVVGTTKTKTEDIILFGRSLGTAVAVDLAGRRPLAAVILVSPFTSGRDMAARSRLAFLLGDAYRPFDTIAKIPHLRAPLLILHGTADALIPIDMGKALFDAAPSPKNFVSIEGAGHNDLSTTYEESYFARIEGFLNSL